MRVEVLINV